MAAIIQESGERAVGMEGREQAISLYHWSDTELLAGLEALNGCKFSDAYS